jgi:hypothetical protein
MRVKGSTVIIVFMYVTWIGYLWLQLWARKNIGAFLPSEVTLGTAALFIVETVSLARLKMAKEGDKVGAKPNNTFLQRIGLNNLVDFEEETQTAQLKAQREKGEQNETRNNQQTEKP